MSSPTTRALLEDAFYQVLDNKIFRLLLILVIVLVAPAFLIGCRTHEVLLLYGWKSISYEEVFRFFGQSYQSYAAKGLDVQAKAIQVYQSLIVESLGGTLGMVVCVSATAFFVPHMLEKGSADIQFSKPVSRTTLLLSRYFAGLLFVGILAFLLVAGIYLGLLVVSGYNDPGFLWGVFTLIYLFAILHAFSTAVGVFTRSTVVAILMSVILFMGSGCVHGAWTIRQYFEEMHIAEKIKAEMKANPDSDLAVSPIVDDDDDAPGASGIVKVAVFALDSLHYTLPKTKDADYLTRMLRKAVAGKSTGLLDSVTDVHVSQPPSEFVLVSPSERAAGERGIPIDLEHETARWVVKDEHAREVASIELARKARLEERPSNGEKRKPRRISTNTAADAYADRVKASGAATGDVLLRRGNVGGNFAMLVDWTETSDGAPKSCHAALFAFGDWMYEARATMDANWLTEKERAARFDTLLQHVELARAGDSIDPGRWYEERFGWTSELPYNAFFSIATSLAFAFLMLWVARAKLQRIDF